MPKQSEAMPTELTADGVLEELRRLAFPPDIRSLYRRGKLKPRSEWTPEQRACVSALEARNGKVVKIRLQDKRRARRLWDLYTNAHRLGRKRSVPRGREL